MSELAIVGAGYWGQAIFDLARERGIEADLYDGGHADSGSRNAAAIVDPPYLRRAVPFLADQIDKSLQWVEDRLGGIYVQEGFWNVFRGEVYPARNRPSKSCYVDPNTPMLLAPLVYGPVERLERLRSGWLINGTAYHWVVIAAGVWTRELLRPLGIDFPMSELYGRGWIVSGEPRYPERMPIEVMVAPYQKYIVRDWGKGFYHIGDTAERKPNPERARAVLARVAAAVFVAYRIEEEMGGRRPITGDRPFIGAPGGLKDLVIATGGRRFGLGLARYAALHSLDSLLINPKRT